MISSRSDYAYVGGDISSVVIDGGVMPLRSSANKKIIRGEDPCFLLEGCLERLEAWAGFSNYSGSSHTSVTNPIALGKWGSVTAPFSRRVEVANDISSGILSSISQCTGIGAAWTLLRRLYTKGSFTSSGATHKFGFLSALPSTAYDISDFESAFDAQGILLKTSALTSTDFDTVLRQSQVNDLFTDLARVNYAYIEIPITSNASKTTEVASTFDEEIGWPSSVTDDDSSCTVSFPWSDETSEWANDGSQAHLYGLNRNVAGTPATYVHESIFDDSEMSISGIEIPAARDTSFYTDSKPRTFFALDVDGQWGTGGSASASRSHVSFSGCTSSGYYSKKHLIDMTNTIGHRSRYYSFGYPLLTDAMMRQLIARDGGQIYTGTSSIYFHQYHFGVSSIIVVIPISDRTKVS